MKQDTPILIILILLVIVLGWGVCSIITIHNSPWVVTNYADTCPTVAIMRYTVDTENDIVKIEIDELESYGNTTIVWEGNQSDIGEISFIVSEEEGLISLMENQS